MASRRTTSGHDLVTVGIEQLFDGTGGVALGAMLPEREIQAWGTWLSAIGRPTTTIELRTYHVRRTFRVDLVDADPWTITTTELVDYLGERRTWGAETRRSWRSSMRVFFEWAVETGRRPDNPADRVRVAKMPRGVPRPAPETVYREALLAADERTRLMVQLAAVCGLRRGEIARTRREHLVEDLDGHSLHVFGKGGHERHVPLPVPLARELLAMQSGWLFPSPVRPGAPLTAEYVGKVVSRLLPEGWTCHTLRHRCATVAYASTRDLRAVQELLGHAKPETTARYTKVPAGAMRAAVLATSA